MTEIVLNRKAFLEGLNAIDPAIPKRTPRPILQNALMTVRRNEIELFATDQEIGIFYVLEQPSESEAVAVLPVARLKKVLSEFSQETVSLDISKEALTVSCGLSEFCFPIMDPSEFPTFGLSIEAPQVQVSTSILKRAIHGTSFATDPDSTRYTLGGVLFDLCDGVLTLVATDSRRLATAAIRVEGMFDVGSVKPVVPLKALTIIERVATESETVLITMCRERVVFRLGGATVYARLIEGHFPSWRKVIPQEFRNRGTVLQNAIMCAVRQSEIVTSNESRGIAFNFSANSLQLSGQVADLGSAKIETPLEYCGDPMQIVLDPRFLAQWLGTIQPEQTVEVQLNSADEAVLWTHGECQYVVMPLTKE